MGVGIGGGSTEVSGKQAFDKLRGYTVLEKLAAALATGRTCRLVPMLLVGSTPSRSSAKHHLKIAGVHCFSTRMFMSERAEIVTI